MRNLVKVGLSYEKVERLVRGSEQMIVKHF
jgi:hypothetical protein